MASELDHLIERHPENADAISQKHAQVDEAWKRLLTKATDRRRKLDESYKHVVFFTIPLFLSSFSFLFILVD